MEVPLMAMMNDHIIHLCHFLFIWKGIKDHIHIPGLPPSLVEFTYLPALGAAVSSVLLLWLMTITDFVMPVSALLGSWFFAARAAACFLVLLSLSLVSLLVLITLLLAAAAAASFDGRFLVLASSDKPPIDGFVEWTDVDMVRLISRSFEGALMNLAGVASTVPNWLYRSLTSG